MSHGSVERYVSGREFVGCEDPSMRHHNDRVGATTALIAEALELPPPFAARIRLAAPLHDIGKLGLPSEIVHKRGPLTVAERRRMTVHVEIGARRLEPARSPVLRMAAEIARTHHERWDGCGYLRGLRRREIPLSGRITAVADVFDALTHERPYKAAWSLDRALAEIAHESAHHFDPEIVEAFLSLDRDILVRQAVAAPALIAA